MKRVQEPPPLQVLLQTGPLLLLLALLRRLLPQGLLLAWELAVLLPRAPWHLPFGAATIAAAAAAPAAGCGRAAWQAVAKVAGMPPVAICTGREQGQAKQLKRQHQIQAAKQPTTPIHGRSVPAQPYLEPAPTAAICWPIDMARCSTSAEGSSIWRSNASMSPNMAASSRSKLGSCLWGATVGKERVMGWGGRRAAAAV